MLPSIQMINGNYFNFNEPEKAEYGIEEIAHALSLTSRFNGHSHEFYSVAQHSVLVSYTVIDPKNELMGLMHDAAEAFIGDVCKPLKELLPEYKEIEDRVEKTVLEKFGVQPINKDVKYADLVLLATEKRDLMPQRAGDIEVWSSLKNIKPRPSTIVPWPADLARQRFLQRYSDLT